MSIYYGGLNNSNGNTVPSNFSVSAGRNASAQSNSVNYNYSLNNAGLLPSNASSSTKSSVMVALAQPYNNDLLNPYGGPYNVIDASQSAGAGLTGPFQPVNTIQNIINLNSSVQAFSQQTLASNSVHIGLYPNAASSTNPYHS